MSSFSAPCCPTQDALRISSAQCELMWGGFQSELLISPAREVANPSLWAPPL
uniref:Uncharacterized protein n=1 Tax=Anguilla anguilla TaxID=7936 RepID=A0A0E9Q4R3_ANGAN